ncbi:MAG: sigma-70 family RNA polymerase sigma factor [Bacteroidetes bacterium]|nr:sigma-70 family RNA polymerase sigma factor [Bacteroidota bacterium]
MSFQKDNYYVDKVLNGDINAYAILVNKHKDMVFTIANRIIRNREDAEEIAQDAFMKAFEHLKNFKKKAKFSTWIYRITYNASISRIRKKNPETISMDDTTVDNFSFDENNLEILDKPEDEQKRLIKIALNHLNEQDHLIITLFYLKEKSVEEISEITNLSKSNIKVKLHRIRNKIYKELYHLIGEKVNLAV